MAEHGIIQGRKTWTLVIKRGRYPQRNARMTAKQHMFKEKMHLSRQKQKQSGKNPSVHISRPVAAVSIWTCHMRSS